MVKAAFSKGASFVLEDLDVYLVVWGDLLPDPHDSVEVFGYLFFGSSSSGSLL